MANTYFQFKQFTVHQDKCGMKVCTDSCILGAYTTFENPSKILDIGTGTGLLSLMLAQKYNCKVDAVEIDKTAHEQAKENFLSSPWSGRLNVYNERIQDFEQKSFVKYDLIVCNPPFFEDHLKSPLKSKTIALHNDELSFKDLVKSVKELLSDKGLFYILLPEYQSSLFELLALKNFLFPVKKLTIRNSEKGPVFRVITAFAPNKYEFDFEEIIIKESNGDYSSDFKNLLRDYYLYL
jgi:tRNA1Val (adenine37-N6)-methyltransferase